MLRFAGNIDSVRIDNDCRQPGLPWLFGLGPNQRHPDIIYNGTYYIFL